MSLTKIIDNNPHLKKEFPNLKIFLRDQHGNALTPTDWKTPIKVSSIGKSFEAGTIGTAFDYVARAMLTRYVGEQQATMEIDFAADKGLKKLNRYLQLPINSSGDLVIDEQRRVGRELAIDSIKQVNAYLHERYTSGMKSRKEFIGGKGSIDTLIKDSIFFTRLDEVYRSQSIHVVDEYFCTHEAGTTYFSQNRTIDNKEIEKNVFELVRLFEIFLTTNRWKSAILNPQFGEYSSKLGGADADFILDGTIVDIKTKGKLGYEGRDFAQLLGYASMARKIGVDVKKVAIYFARFGLFACFDLESNVLSPRFLDHFLDALVSCQEH